MKFHILVGRDYIKAFHHKHKSKDPFLTQTIQPSQPILYLERYPEGKDQYTMAAIKEAGMKQDEEKFNIIRNTKMKLSIMATQNTIKGDEAPKS